MAYKLPIEARAIVLKNFPDLSPIQKDRICQGISEITGQLIERFIASVRVDPSEAKNLKMTHVPADKQETFIAGGEYAIGFYNMVLNKYLKEQGMNPVV